ncbi:hypothetical protein H5J22_02645 [Cetobacterium sp. 8H]|uniref:hypothetical protein n=1 Tax=Cetobacterium sp. 8H TaxID=2759681 RepID=UPI00163CA80D|nr:hypothetical protein [Cetobacterium sp. 8H]MBC2850342.1 hypothetical protein [Cetobacterium sp. 8H]
MRERYNFYRCLNENQSLKYQMMVILMEEHRKARRGKDYIGTYDGIDTLTFDKVSWNKMLEKIKKYVSKEYRENFRKNKINLDMILGIFSTPNDYCSLRYYKIKEQEYIQFMMKDVGYSYQYNKYSKSQDRLQKKANYFLLMTLVYYVVSWFFDSPKIDLTKFLKAFFLVLHQDIKIIIYILVGLGIFKILIVDKK